MRHFLTAAAFATLVAVSVPAHAQTAECSDGSNSYSAHYQGVCSWHGGVAVWQNQGMKDEANQWCDENPVRCALSHWEGIEGHGDHIGVGVDEEPQQ